MLGFYLALFVYLFSDGTVVGCTASPYGCVDWNLRMRRFFGFAAFGMLWTCLWVAHFTQFIISSVAAHWYFGSAAPHPVLRSVRDMVRYHLGSIAFGAIVLTLMSVFGLLLQLLYVRTFRSRTADPSASRSTTPTAARAASTPACRASPAPSSASCSS